MKYIVDLECKEINIFYTEDEKDDPRIGAIRNVYTKKGYKVITTHTEMFEVSLDSSWTTAPLTYTSGYITTTTGTWNPSTGNYITYNTGGGSSGDIEYSSLKTIEE